jgi:hypothetical protein
MLGLEAECVATFVGCSALAFERSKKVAAIKLDSRLSREHAQYPPRGRVVGLSRFRQFSTGRVQYPVVVVTVTQAKLFVISVNPFSMTLELRKSCGVESTDLSSPVGIRVESTGVNRDACSLTR